MLKLRINPIVAKDLKNIRVYIAEDNEEYAAKTIKEIYGKFENLQMFPEMGLDLSKRVSFRTDYKYAIWAAILGQIYWFSFMTVLQNFIIISQIRYW